MLHCTLKASCHDIRCNYRIARNFSEVFNLANWQFCRKSPSLKPANIISHTIALCRSSCDHQIKNSPMHSDDRFAKFNARQNFPLYVINELISSEIRSTWVQEVWAHPIQRHSALEYAEIDMCSAKFLSTIKLTSSQFLPIILYGQPKGKNTGE